MVILHYSLATKYLSKQSLRLFVEFLKVKLIVDVTHWDVRRFMLYLSEGGGSLICARKHLLSLRRFYDFLNLGGLVDHVAPLPGTEKYGKTGIMFLARSAADAPQNYIQDRRIGYVFQQDYPLQTGVCSDGNGIWVASRKECADTSPGCTLTTKYLSNSARVSREKAKSKFDEVLAGARLARPKRNAPVTSTSVGNILRRLGRRAGITRTTADMLRHSFATH